MTVSARGPIYVLANNIESQGVIRVEPGPTSIEPIAGMQNEVWLHSLARGDACIDNVNDPDREDQAGKTSKLPKL
jgi:hypothetical protein